MQNAPVPPGGVHAISAVPLDVIPNAHAVFADFIGEDVINNAGSLTNGNVSVGFLNIREFIVQNFPVVASTFNRIGEGNFFLVTPDTGPGGAVIANSSITGITPNITLDLGNNIANILGTTIPFNPIHLDDLRELGLVGGTQEQLNAFLGDIRRLYNSNGSEIVYNHGVTESDIRRQLKTKTSFGVCPHASFKVGYFYKEMNACLYAKAGFILLKGQASIISDYIAGEGEKFNKLAPFFAIGISKMIDKNWGISAEVSHALKTHKKMSDIRWRGYKIENKASISKTDLRILVTYTF
jgi:hypothetical protein